QPADGGCLHVILDRPTRSAAVADWRRLRAECTVVFMNPTFTIGIEEEYQTVDPVTRDLRSHIHAEIIEKGKLILQERVKAEMHAYVVEVGTSVCDNIKDCKHEVRKLRRDMIALTNGNGSPLASAASDQFADLPAAAVTAADRHKTVDENLTQIAQGKM